MNEIYLSTGAFTGRVNRRNLHLLAENFRAFDCDGFEYMVFEDSYGELDTILPLYKGIRIPVVHSDKEIGDLLSTEGNAAFCEAEKRLLANLLVCEEVGAAKMVLHGWGKPDSDVCPERTVERILRLVSIAKRRGVDLLCENCCCVHSDPLTMFGKLLSTQSDLHFIFDTRPAQFHRQIPETFASDIFRKHAVHMHINDFAGGYKEWSALYPIPQPGKGLIDWNLVFSSLRDMRYQGSITLEAPSMQSEGVDSATLNRSLAFIRQNLI